MISDKFPQNGVGLKNPVLEAIRDKILKHREKQKNNIQKRYQTSTKPSTKEATKTIPLEVENEKENIIEEIGSEKTKEIANEVWKDEHWRSSLCMGLSITTPELKKWMAKFNASICNDKIHDFSKSKYKKMIQGWIQSKQSNGVKVDAGIEKKSDSPPLTKLN
jgi:hypothetical protein